MKGRIWLMLLVGVLFTACRKELCYTHDEHSLAVRLDVKASWDTTWERDYGCAWADCWNSGWGCTYDELSPKVPEGVRLTAYPREGVSREYNLPPEGKRVVLDGEGIYSLLLYNNDTEYIVYDGLTSSTRATATTRTVSRSSFRALHEGERTVNPPDMLYGKYVEEYVAVSHEGADLLDAELNPLVYTYLVRYEFSAGREHVVLARGAMAGMAETVYLHDGHTGSEAATILYDCELKDYGAEARVKTFGVPDYPGDHYNRGEEDARHYMVNLEVRLTNGAFKTFEVDITDQMAKQPRGGVIVVQGLEVTDEEAKQPDSGGGGGGGFDVGVEGWGDAIDIPLPL